METKNERNEVQEDPTVEPWRNCVNGFDLSTLNLGFRISGGRQEDLALARHRGRIGLGEVMQPLSG